MTQLQVLVNQDVLRAAAEGTSIGLKGTKRGEACVIDFYTEMALEGRGFQVRAGTISVPLVGDVVITDTAAELAVDAGQGVAIMPVYLSVSINVGTGTLHEYAVKSVDAASSAGATFVPLPMIMDTNAVASRATARVAAAGGVTVTAELATTTRRHWSWDNPVAVGAGNAAIVPPWTPRMPPTIANDGCVYVQVAAAGTGPSYYANLDFLELPWVNIS